MLEENNILAEEKDAENVKSDLLDDPVCKLK
jgi:hypothetical protein